MELVLLDRDRSLIIGRLLNERLLWLHIIIQLSTDGKDIVHSESLIFLVNCAIALAKRSGLLEDVTGLSWRANCLITCQVMVRRALLIVARTRECATMSITFASFLEIASRVVMLEQLVEETASLIGTDSALVLRGT